MKISRRVKAALFDLDGTLVDSLADLTDAVNFLLMEFGKSSLTRTEVCKLVGKGSRNLVQQALKSDSSDEIERGLGLFVSFNSSHIADKSTLYPGIAEALEEMFKNDVKLAIVSNKNEALSRQILETLGISEYFEIVCGGDSFSEMKPSPLPLLCVMERFGIAPGEAAMVGDSKYDIEAGSRAGIPTMGCSWGYGDPADLVKASHVVCSCRDMVAILLGRSALPLDRRKQ